jgi:hypothetical protein
VAGHLLFSETLIRPVGMLTTGRIWWWLVEFSPRRREVRWQLMPTAHPDQTSNRRFFPTIS